MLTALKGPSIGGFYHNLSTLSRSATRFLKCSATPTPKGLNSGFSQSTQLKTALMGYVGFNLVWGFIPFGLTAMFF